MDLIFGAFVQRLGRRPLTPVTGVRVPYALPFQTVSPTIATWSIHLTKKHGCNQYPCLILSDDAFASDRRHAQFLKILAHVLLDALKRCLKDLPRHPPVPEKARIAEADQ